MDELNVFEHGFTKVPAFFIRDLLPIADGIPASFWKYLLVVWADIVGLRPGRCYKTMKQFYMTKDTAMKWTAALSVSCLFTVHYGKKHKINAPGTPSLIEYQPGSTCTDWICFINALREAVLNDKDKNVNDIEGFRIQLAFTLRDERSRNGLSTQALQDIIKGWVDEGLVQVKDGKCTWQRKDSDRSWLLNAEVRSYLYGEEPQQSRSIR